MAEANQTSINIPQIIAVALVGFLAIRWYLNKTPSNTSNATSSRGRQVDINKIDQVSAMFPQLDRRTIAWDLHHNGGNVSATTERVLAGRGLDQPPPSFQPNIPPPASAGASSGQQKNVGGMPDLITRYNLQTRISGKGKQAMPSEEEQRRSKQGSWSADKGQRADGLKRRREEMILEARRRMEAKGSES